MDVGQRQERCRGKSEISGEYVVEDVTVNGEVYRRLIFFNKWPGFLATSCFWWE